MKLESPVIVDSNMRIIGWFNFREDLFRLYKDYKYRTEAASALASNGIEYELVTLEKTEL